MAYDPTDATTARHLLEDAIALAKKPALSSAQVDRAFALASSLDDDANTVYLPGDLNRAAAWAWGVKAGLAADEFDIGGGSGKYLKRGDTKVACLAMKAQFLDGSMAVVPESMRSGGRGVWSIPVVGSGTEP